MSTRKVGGMLGREQIIIRETNAAELASEDQGPTATERQSAKMLVDAFGHQTAQPAPYMEQLAQEFSVVQRGGARVKRPLERIEQQGTIPHSTSRFSVARDWDIKPEAGGFDLGYQSEYELDFNEDQDEEYDEDDICEPTD